MIGLLIEDDPEKAKEILGYIKEKFPHCEMTYKLSYQSGLKEIFSEKFDFILLDMSLPSYDQGNGNFSGKPRNFGGRDILKEMKRYKKSSVVKIITQYNEFDDGLLSLKNLDTQLKSKYNELYYGYIYYKSNQTEWEKELFNFISSL
ncbi:response regulator [Flavobacterium soli]|uniref:response regulator n=1 Tax=Flavobacterium soli TaxID=344881 RepID=UPI000478693D|nr:response regulator [Flavobacterium soli]